MAGRGQRLTPGHARGSPERDPLACRLVVRAGLASSGPRTRPGVVLGDSPRITSSPGVASVSPASALRSPGPESLGLSLQRMNVPRRGQRPGGPLGWSDVPTYVPAASPHLPPRSRPLPPRAPLGLSGALQATWCADTVGHVRFGGFCSAVSVIDPASASHLSRLCRHI